MVRFSKKMKSNDKAFLGVVSGYACYLGWDIEITRVVAFILALFFPVFFVVIYFILSMSMDSYNPRFIDRHHH